MPSNISAGSEGCGGSTSTSTSTLTIVHISDTHGMHRKIESSGFKLPHADLLVHTGDFTDVGLDREFELFDEWCAEITPRYTHGVVVIAGNHEYKKPLEQIEDGVVAVEDVCGPAFIRSRLPSCRVLHHEMLEVAGLRIFGSPWVPWARAGNPDTVGSGAGHAAAWRGAAAAHATLSTAASAQPGGQHAAASALPPHRFGDIPAGTDILLTHGPAAGVFDTMEGCLGHCWGSSNHLRASIYRTKPVAHLFGHLHEQRGQWLRSTGATGSAGASTPGRYVGGVEYEATPGVPYVTNGPPPADYPADLVCCTAMKNHPGCDGKKPSIAGPGRLITATHPRVAGGRWAVTARPL